jgi:hypothetical protein
MRRGIQLSTQLATLISQQQGIIVGQQFGSAGAKRQEKCVEFVDPAQSSITSDEARRRRDHFALILAPD